MIVLLRGNHRQPTRPRGVVLMASISILGIPFWGKPYLPLLGALGLSLYHGGGLRAPFLFSRGGAGMANATGPRAWWGL